MMKIDSTSVDFNTNFKSRNQAVIKADKICRMVKTEFPSVSSSSLIPRCYKKIQDSVKRFGKPTPNIENGDAIDQKYYNMYDLFLRTDIRISDLIRNPFHNAKGITKAYKLLTKLVKRYHCANCAELTRLANLICAVNGIDSTPIGMMLCDKEGKIFSYVDHAALAIPLKEGSLSCNKMSKIKDVIIIDPWLGIADYARNAALEYQNKFQKHLNMPKDSQIMMDPFTSLPAIPIEEFQNLRKEFPNLILNA